MIEKPLVLTLQNIAKVDSGKIAVTIDHALQAVVRDVLDRPMDEKARQVQLTISCTPDLDDDDGKLVRVNVQFHINAKVPKRQSKVYPMLYNDHAELIFQPGSPSDPTQGALGFDEPDPETGEVPLDAEDETPAPRLAANQ